MASTQAVPNLDKTFVDSLKEIEHSYVNLPKAVRIIVEKWIEKLAISSDSNIVWKRHRNYYVKLLLGMVVGKSITDPFNHPPPEGPLPSFPSQYKHKFKGMLGAHETSFWRELYHRMQDHQLQPPTALVAHSHSIDSSSSQISREIQNLMMITKEQATRISLLEQQLHDERVQHELQIQRIYYAHRIELGRLKHMASVNDTIVLTHREESDTSTSLPYTVSSNQDNTGILSRSSVHSPDRQQFEQGMRRDSLDTAINRRQPPPIPIPTSYFLDGRPRASSPIRHTQGRIPPPSRSSSSLLLSSGTFNPTDQSHEKYPANFPLTASGNASTYNLGQTSINLAGKAAQENATKVPDADEEYLKYIESFQSEIQRLQSGPIGASEFRQYS